MSIYLATEQGYLGQFASNKGYSDLIAAVGNWDLPALQSLFHHGLSEHVPEVRKDLNKLIRTCKDADVLISAKALRDLLKGRDNDVVVVSNGI